MRRFRLLAHDFNEDLMSAGSLCDRNSLSALAKKNKSLAADSMRRCDAGTLPSADLTLQLPKVLMLLFRLIEQDSSVEAS